MQEEKKGKNRKRRKKKSKFGYYLYAVVILVLTITNIVLAVLLLTHVQDIRVIGTKHSESSEIVRWIEEDPMTKNSLYTLWKFKSGKYTLPVYLQDIQVRLGKPWVVNVTVTEKSVIGCSLLRDTYVYYDAEGLVLRKSSQYDQTVPYVEGLAIEQADQFAYLEMENDKLFSYIVSVTNEVKKEKLQPDRIVWEDDSMNLYFEDVCVKLGKSNFKEKILELPPILEKLEGESGILQMEHYNSESTGISFEKNNEES